MPADTFRCPRLTDREVVERFGQICKEMGLEKAQIRIMPFQGGSWITGTASTLPGSEVFQSLVRANAACAQQFHLVVPSAPRTDHTLIQLHRLQEDLFDKIVLDWPGGNPLFIPEAEFVKLLGLVRSRFGEIKIGEALTGFPNDTINRYLEARDATLTRLESVNEELLFRIHERQKELEDKYAVKVSASEKDFDGRRRDLEAQHEQQTARLKEEEAAFKKRIEEFETHESKYLRRQLSKDMLKRLESFQAKFELTKGTRNLRTPVLSFCILLLILFGTLMGFGFYETFTVIKTTDVSKINTLLALVLVLKQLGFTGAFIATAYFFIKWNDRWFRQHADAEFMFKQLELDINRASWVVEMAMEWKAEKGIEIPTELLDRLTHNLFRDNSSSGKDGDAPPNVADILLGSAASVRIKTPGAEIDLDRKGVQKAVTQLSAK